MNLKATEDQENTVSKYYTYNAARPKTDENRSGRKTHGVAEAYSGLLTGGPEGRPNTKGTQVREIFAGCPLNIRGTPFCCFGNPLTLPASVNRQLGRK